MRVAVLAVFALLLLGTPVWAQSDAEIEIEKLISELGDEDREVRNDAVHALGKIGPRAVSALSAALLSEDENLRVWAAIALAGLGPDAAPAVPALIRSLSHLHVRSIAIPALVNLGSPAVLPLAAALSDEDWNIRDSAAWVLGEIGPRAAPAVPALVSLLSDDDRDVRAGGARALYAIGPEAASAVPALADAVSDRDRTVRRWGTKALDQIGTALKAQGTVLWWVVPRVYWKGVAGLALLLAGWFLYQARFPKHRPASTHKQLTHIAWTALVPGVLACFAVHHAITREWAQGFLPDAVTLVPFPVAAVLSTALVVTLPAIWVCQRKSVAPEAEVLGT